MREHELDASRIVPNTVNLARIDELNRWFHTTYLYELAKINRYAYLGLPLERSRYDLELEAYNKENELRKLTGKPLLPESKYRDIL